jgi:glutamine synthetase adenylyltransferase
MATLTYDSTETPEGEFTEEEQENIKVGEALAGKFKDAEDLESAYIELQKKLGDPSRDEPEAEADTTEPEEEVEEEEEEVELLDRLWEESQKDEISEETLKELSDMDPKDVAKSYLKYRADNTQPVMTEEDRHVSSQFKL